MIRKTILMVSLLLPGCSYIIHNEYYQIIDKSKTVYDAGAYITDNKTSTDMIVESLFKDKPTRVTGFSCGSKMYSDYPCMEALGCIVLND